MDHLKSFPLFEAKSPIQAKRLVISQSDPLSKQLKRETGDSYNKQDFDDEQVGSFHITTHKKTGKTFIVYTKNYYDTIDNRELIDDERYLENMRNIVVTNSDAIRNDKKGDKVMEMTIKFFRETANGDKVGAQIYIDGEWTKEIGELPSKAEVLKAIADNDGIINKLK